MNGRIVVGHLNENMIITELIEREVPVGAIHQHILVMVNGRHNRRIGEYLGMLQAPHQGQRALLIAGFVRDNIIDVDDAQIRKRGAYRIRIHLLP